MTLTMPVPTTAPARPERLVIQRVEHPGPAVRQVGFDLRHEYVELVLAARLGPSAVMFLRRLPALWDAHGPLLATPTLDMAHSLGLGGVGGGGRHGAFARTLRRLVAFHVAEDRPDGIRVYRTAAPLAPRELRHVGTLARSDHDRLLAAHLDGMAGR